MKNIEDKRRPSGIKSNFAGSVTVNETAFALAALDEDVNDDGVMGIVNFLGGSALFESALKEYEAGILLEPNGTDDLYWIRLLCARCFNAGSYANRIHTEREAGL